MYSLERCDAYSGLLSGTLLRDYQALYSPLLATAAVSRGHQQYSQEQPEEHQEGLQSPGRGGEGLWSAGSFFINPPSQMERV